MSQSSDARTEGHAAFRRVLLRVVFWALGLAAVFGAAGVIFAGHETLWRIVGTCAATAGAALILLAASRLLDVEATWPQGMALIALTAFEYLATLGQIWRLFGGADEPVGLTMTFVAVTAIPAIALSTGLARPEAAVTARVGIVAAACALVLFLVGSWGHYLTGMRQDRWFDVGGWLALFGALAIACLIGTAVDRRHWRWLGVAGAAVAFVIATRATLLETEPTSKLFTVAVTTAAVVAHASLVVRVPLRANQRWLLWGTVAAGVGTGFFIDLARLTRPWQAELLGRFAGAAAIVGGCGTLALVVLARINQRGFPVETGAAELREVTLSCPRCRKKQVVAIGSATCQACGLIIEVRVEDPSG